MDLILEPWTNGPNPIVVIALKKTTTTKTVEESCLPH